MAKKIVHRYSQGFTLVEVLIALTIFSLFMAIFAVSQGYNLSDSVQMKEDLKLRVLCESVIDDIITTPPEYAERLTLAPETKTFEDDSAYEYTITYKRFKIPDISKIQGKEEGEDQQSDEGGNAAASAMLMNKIKENMEEMIWQVEVKVKNKSTNYYFTLSTWLLNDKIEPKFGI